MSIFDRLRDGVVTTSAEETRAIAAEFGACPLIACDVASDDQIAMAFDTLKSEWGALDTAIPSIDRSTASHTTCSTKPTATRYIRGTADTATKGATSS